MAIPTATGFVDLETNEVLPSDQGTWSDISALTWDNWTTWNVNPSDVMTWVSDPIVFPSVQDFNLKIQIEANGVVDYYVYTSETGEFDGEEVETEILNGDTNVDGFTAKAVIVAVNVTKTVGINKISGISISASTRSIGETLTVDTSALSGSITARQIPITRVYSKITTITVSPKQVTAYNVDLYVSNYATSSTVIPRVVSKDRTTPTIALLGIDGSTKDAQVDIAITGLPEQYMKGNNLLVR